MTRPDNRHDQADPCKHSIETDQMLERFDQTVMELSDRMRQLELRQMQLRRKVSQQEESIRMMSLILKDLDDPYGSGLTVDERIAQERFDPQPGEDEG